VHVHAVELARHKQEEDVVQLVDAAKGALLLVLKTASDDG
jgi:hypothetical protein